MSGGPMDKSNTSPLANWKRSHFAITSERVTMHSAPTCWPHVGALRQSSKRAEERMSYDQVGTLYVVIPWVAVGVMYCVMCLYNLRHGRTPTRGK